MNLLLSPRARPDYSAEEMDHIQLPPDSWLKLPDIPLLCGTGQLESNVAFSDYPSSRGFDKSLFQDGNFSEHGAESTAALLQEWLFFHLLKKTIGTLTEIDWSGFQAVDPLSRRCLVSTKGLNNSLERWKQCLHNSEHSFYLLDCFTQASFYTMCLLSEDGEPKPHLTLSPEVLLSFIVLGSTLFKAFREATHSSVPHRFRMYTHQRSSEILIPSLLRNWLLKNGYCRHYIAQLAQTEDIPTILYISALQQSTTILEARHDACSKAVCRAVQIDERHYSTKHADHGCSCSHIPAPLKDVKGILQRGGIPILRIPENLELEVEDSQGLQEQLSPRGKPYVAISHVWADGLGNPSANSLPACQMTRLRRLVNKFQPIVNNPLKQPRPTLLEDKASSELDIQHCPHIWIDTLCIPRESPSAAEYEKQEMNRYRQLAIMQMNDTFARAGAVLVLDAELAMTPCNQPFPELIHQLIARLKVCGWMKRVWTYLEAALGGKRLYVQFNGGALHIWSAQQSFQLERSWNLQNDITYKVLSELCNLYSFWVRYTLPGPLTDSLDEKILERFHNDIRGRSTTRQGDEYLCLAIILRIPQEKLRRLIRTPIEERARIIVQNFKSFPRSIIFSPGQKLLNDGYRWVCSSFWQTVIDHDLLTGQARLCPNDEGLEMEVSAIIFPPGETLFNCISCGHSWIFYELPSSRRYKATVDSRVEAVIHSVTKRCDEERWWETRAFAILLPDTMGFDHDDVVPVPGALVSMVEKIPWDKITNDQKFEEEYDSDASGYFTRVYKDAYECRYISTVTISLTEIVKLDQFPQSECRRTLDLNWRIL